MWEYFNEIWCLKSIWHGERNKSFFFPVPSASRTFSWIYDCFLSSTIRKHENEFRPCFVLYFCALNHRLLRLLRLLRLHRKLFNLDRSLQRFAWNFPRALIFSSVRTLINHSNRQSSRKWERETSDSVVSPRRFLRRHRSGVLPLAKAQSH